MLRPLLAGLLFMITMPAGAQVQPFPSSFHTQEIGTNGTVIHVRVGGHGPSLSLRFPQSGSEQCELECAVRREDLVFPPDVAFAGLRELDCHAGTAKAL